VQVVLAAQQENCPALQGGDKRGATKRQGLQPFTPLIPLNRASMVPASSINIFATAISAQGLKPQSECGGDIVPPR